MIPHYRVYQKVNRVFLRPCWALIAIILVNIEIYREAFDRVFFFFYVYSEGVSPFINTFEHAHELI